MTVLIFDSTTLIHMGKAGLLDHLKDLDLEMLIPASIHDEVVLEGKKRGAPIALRCEAITKEGTIKVVVVEKGKMHSRLKDNGSLSGPDLDVLELALKMKGTAIMDERYGRSVCEIEGIRHRGTVWLLKEFTEAGSLSGEEAREALDRLIEEGWYCSTRFYSKVIRSFDEQYR